jgi:predicted Zn-dependent protease with MMP-like domain
MTRERFEETAQEIFDTLPEIFGKSIDNVHIVVEDYPSDDVINNMRTGKYALLGLYQGIPLTHRGTWYGASPTLPDRISLYQKNIEAQCGNDGEVVECIQEVLFHELGHYFGMNEREIRNAMSHFRQSQK